jgi:hypothetical protein
MRDRTRFERELGELQEYEQEAPNQSFKVIGAADAVLGKRATRSIKMVRPSRVFRTARGGDDSEGSIPYRRFVFTSRAGYAVWSKAHFFSPTMSASSTAANSSIGGSPMSCWQQDHIMRRPVQLRRSYLSAAARVPIFQAVPFRIRVGPPIRFVDHTQALVDIDLRPTPGHARIRGDELPNVAIRQQHFTWNPNRAAIETYDFYYSNNEASGPKLLTPARKS